MVCSLCKSQVRTHVTSECMPDTTFCSTECRDLVLGVVAFDGSVCPKCSSTLSHIGKLMEGSSDSVEDYLVEAGFIKKGTIQGGDVWCCGRCEWILIRLDAARGKWYLVFDTGNELTVLEIKRT